MRRSGGWWSKSSARGGERLPREKHQHNLALHTLPFEDSRCHQCADCATNSGRAYSGGSLRAALALPSLHGNTHVCKRARHQMQRKEQSRLRHAEQVSDTRALVAVRGGLFARVQRGQQVRMPMVCSPVSSVLAVVYIRRSPVFLCVLRH